MIQNQIDALESQLRNSSNIPEVTKASLLHSLAELKTEAQTLGSNGEKQADSNSRTNEPQSVEAAFEDLRATVESFETTHPKLAGMVSQIASTLSNMGI